MREIRNLTSLSLTHTHSHTPGTQLVKQKQAKMERWTSNAPMRENRNLTAGGGEALLSTDWDEEESSSRYPPWSDGQEANGLGDLGRYCPSGNAAPQTGRHDYQFSNSKPNSFPPHRGGGEALLSTDWDGEESSLSSISSIYDKCSIGPVS